MAKLPDKYDLSGPISLRSQRDVASYDTTAIGRGVERFGAGLASLGTDIAAVRAAGRSGAAGAPARPAGRAHRAIADLVAARAAAGAGIAAARIADSAAMWTVGKVLDGPIDIAAARAAEKGRVTALESGSSDGGYLAALTDLVQSFANDGNYATQGARYDRSVARLKALGAKKIADLHARGLWLAHADQAANAARKHLTAAAEQGIRRNRHVNWIRGLQDYARVVADPDAPPALRDQARRNLEDSIYVAASNEQISPRQAEEYRNTYVRGSDFIFGQRELDRNPYALETDGVFGDHLAGNSTTEVARPHWYASQSPERQLILERHAKAHQGRLRDERRSALARDREIERERRSETVKVGYDLMSGDALTDDWVEANRDILSPSDYRAFRKALLPSEQARKPDADKYLDFLDLADAEPGRALAEVREAFGRDEIARETFDVVTRRATENLASPRGRTYAAELRSYLATSLSAGSEAAPAIRALELGARFQFDDWMKANPQASRDEARKQVQMVITDFRKVRSREMANSLPLPRFSNVPPQNMTMKELAATKERLAAAFRTKQINERDATEQAAILRRWAANLEFGDD